MDDPRSTTPSDSVATTNGLLPSLILAVASVVGLLAISILPASIPIFVPDLIERYGAQLEDLGALFIGGSIIAVFLVMPIAFLADRFGYPYSLLAVFAVAAICMLNAAISTSLDSAITAHVIASIMSAAAIPITVVLVYRTASANWRSTSIALVLIAPMAAGPIVAALSSYEATRVGILIGTATVIAACAIAIAVNSEASARPVRRFRPHIFDGRVVWWIAAAALCASVVGAIPASGPSLMLSIGERLQEIIRSGTHVLTYPTLGVLSGMLLGGMSADLLGRRSGRPDIRVGIGGAILAAVAAIATTAFDEPGGFLLAVAFVGFGVGAVLPVAHSSVQHLAGRQFAAAAAATISTAATFGATVGAGTLSSLFASLSRTRAQTEALDLSFLWLAVVGIAAAAMFFLARQSEPNERASISARTPLPAGQRSRFVLRRGSGVETEYVKNGFSWPAFFFGPLWAVVKGMVPLAGVLLLVNILFLGFFVWLSAVYNITGDAGGQAQLGSVAFVAYPLWLAWVGARANSWRRRRLLWQGYEEVVDPEE